MGLACAPQIEHNHRFIDDILSLSGCFPSMEEYGMQYKQGSPKDGELVYLGMVLSWDPDGSTTKFITGMHFRDAVYPIKIRRYPGWLDDHRLSENGGGDRPIHQGAEIVFHTENFQGCCAERSLGRHVPWVFPS